MKKSVLAFTTAAILAGSAATYAVAQQPQEPQAQKPNPENTWKPSSADRAAFAAARVAALHAGLALTPEQEKLWPPVESVLRDLAQKREARFEAQQEERRTAREKGERPDPMGRLRQTADRLAEAGADLKRLADAAQPLYEKLDDQQKQRLRQLVRQGIEERVHERMRERMMHRFSEWRDRFDNGRGDDRHDGGMMRDDHDRMMQRHGRMQDQEDDYDDDGADTSERL